MDAPKIRNYGDGPTRKIQENLIEFLKLRGWFILKSHGNNYQKGFPNTWATHKTYRSRWIHCKPADDRSFTGAQLECFPKMCAFGSGVWVLCDATESEYQKLWKPSNWQQHYGKVLTSTSNFSYDREGSGPERSIQNSVVDLLKINNWYVMETHGNMYQRGFPDLWATHCQYGSRWIEIKNPCSYSFTPAQLDTFPKICNNGSGVWIIGAATECELAKLQKPCNWYEYFLNLNRKCIK